MTKEDLSKLIDECCPECKSTDLKVAIHTDYNECNKCYHYWET